MDRVGNILRYMLEKSYIVVKRDYSAILKKKRNAVEKASTLLVNT